MTSTLKLGSKIPISEIEGDISEASGMTGFLDDDLTKLSQAGKEAVFKAICQGINNNNYVTIADNGSMPFDGWCWIRVWWTGNGQYGQSTAQINNSTVAMSDSSTAGSCDNDTVIIPVKKGDVVTNHKKGSSPFYGFLCRLFPLNQQEAA